MNPTIDIADVLIPLAWYTSVLGVILAIFS